MANQVEADGDVDADAVDYDTGDQVHDWVGTAVCDGMRCSCPVDRSTRQRVTMPISLQLRAQHCKRSHGDIANCCTECFYPVASLRSCIIMPSCFLDHAETGQQCSFAVAVGYHADMKPGARRKPARSGGLDIPIPFPGVPLCKTLDNLEEEFGACRSSWARL